MSRDDDTITERTFTASIRCDNAAFDGEACGPELARILRRLADDLASGNASGKPGDYLLLFDINGNQCGDAEMTVSDYRR